MKGVLLNALVYYDDESISQVAFSCNNWLCQVALSCNFRMSEVAFSCGVLV